MHLTTPEHQVAGHIAKDGKPGPLVDDKGRFFKPLQGESRGDNEVKFYESFSSNAEVPDHIRRYFPVYHGTQAVEGSDGGTMIVLENLLAKYSKPSVMDVKMGSRTWYPEASEEYIQKCLRKDTASTTVLAGFRISGFEVYDHKELSFWKPDRKLLNGIKVDGVRSALRKFVSSNTLSETSSKPDCAFASSVYGGSNGILAQLLELKTWFESQTFYHFNSCSILMVYENDSILEGNDDDARPQVKLVDFAHVLDNDGIGVIDHNFLGGLCSFINFIRDVLQSQDESAENLHSSP
uniref:Inositol polyphosphate multikinase n=1 Tax=Noccaea caerulescens TaxID=107243 RepID=A0A1J3JZA9_NOCCA